MKHFQYAYLYAWRNIRRTEMPIKGSIQRTVTTPTYILASKQTHTTIYKPAYIAYLPLFTASLQFDGIITI